MAFTPHMLRHTYATDLLHRGLPAEVVQKLLGHASITTTMNVYAQLQVEDVRRSLEQVRWLPTLNAALTQ
ncbi:site-specific recombinase XerD [Nakamurella sp. UYEF19]